MLMKALKLSHPRSDQLDLSFAVDGAGAVKLPESGSGKPPRELLKVAVDECECAALPCCLCFALAFVSSA